MELFQKHRRTLNRFTFSMQFSLTFVNTATNLSTIHYFLLGLPCAFCLLVNKKAVTYRHIFTELKEIATKQNKVFSPEVIMSDFESGLLPVIKSEVVCFYHRSEFNTFICSFPLLDITPVFFTLLRRFFAEFNTSACKAIMCPTKC